ncbi:MAG: ABC transporter ATP-binding protein [Victivallales bacterium]|nr:ABC transporter ATP-binding protein [Victivallales bacterium]
MLIEIQDMFKTYKMGDNVVNALNGVSLTVDYGEFVAIMGHSGSGKSTMLNILGCLDTPTSGSYLLDGRQVSGMNRNELAVIRNQKLGFVFQNFNLLPRTSAVENVELPAMYGNKIKSSERRDRAIELLTKVGLGERLWHTPAQMSGGQQQRVAIARALMNKPAVILADEPTGNLDSKASVEIVEFLASLNDDGITVVMVTHEDDIAAHAKRVVVMSDGKVVSERSNAK